MTLLRPYHERTLILAKRAGEYNKAVNASNSVARWYPLWLLLHQSFRGGKEFSDLEIGSLLRLKEEYESGFSRRG
jgi:hypothetical protein